MTVVVPFLLDIFLNTVHKMGFYRIIAPQIKGDSIFDYD